MRQKKGAVLGQIRVETFLDTVGPLPRVVHSGSSTMMNVVLKLNNPVYDLSAGQVNTAQVHCVRHCSTVASATVYRPSMNFPRVPIHRHDALRRVDSSIEKRSALYGRTYFGQNDFRDRYGTNVLPFLGFPLF